MTAWLVGKAWPGGRVWLGGRVWRGVAVALEGGRAWFSGEAWLVGKVLLGGMVWLLGFTEAWCGWEDNSGSVVVQQWVGGVAGGESVAGLDGVTVGIHRGVAWLGEKTTVDLWLSNRKTGRLINSVVEKFSHAAL